MRTLFLSALAIGMLASCGNPKPKEYDKAENLVLAPPGVRDIALDAPAKAPADTAKKIIKFGEISFETKDPVAARKKILNSLTKLGGYVAEDNETYDSDSNRQRYT